MNERLPVDRALIARERSTGRDDGQPRASVVIVAYNTPPRLLAENLRSLARQTVAGFETIIVDNSDRKDLERTACAHPVHYVKLRRNYGLSLARNVGTHFARGEVVIFLDDDAIPAPDFVEQHLRGHDRRGIAGLRGKALPRTRTIYNLLTTQYDLGDEIRPYPITLEGNSSFKKAILQDMGGFAEHLQGAGGYEGAELSFRIIRDGGDRSRLVYFPGAVIYHDFCGSFWKYVRKLRRHASHRIMLRQTQPELFAFLDSYFPLSRGGPEQPRSPLVAIRLWLIGKGASLVLRLGSMFTRHGR